MEFRDGVYHLNEAESRRLLHPDLEALARRDKFLKELEETMHITYHTDGSMTVEVSD